jgi:hypothetical protein
VSDAALASHPGKLPGSNISRPAAGNVRIFYLLFTLFELQLTRRSFIVNRLRSTFSRVGYLQEWVDRGIYVPPTPAPFVIGPEPGTEAHV